MKKISVVIPVYNIEKYIAETLDSILAQSEDDLEIVLVDDMSTDGSVGVIKKYKEDHPDVQIRLITPGKKLKACGARNLGVEESLGRYIAFLDGDADGTGKYSYWYQAFDNVGIDLALSSDTHAYSRSKTLFNDHEDIFGTVYVTSPKTDGKELSEIVSDDEQLGIRSAFNSVATVTGGCYIDVTPQEMTLHLIGKDGIEYDSVVIPARR